jgi:hypothetical protein
MRLGKLTRKMVKYAKEIKRAVKPRASRLAGV